MRPVVNYQALMTQGSKRKIALSPVEPCSSSDEFSVRETICKDKVPEPLVVAVENVPSNLESGDAPPLTRVFQSFLKCKDSVICVNADHRIICMNNDFSYCPSLFVSVCHSAIKSLLSVGPLLLVVAVVLSANALPPLSIRVFIACTLLYGILVWQQRRQKQTLRSHTATGSVAVSSTLSMDTGDKRSARLSAPVQRRDGLRVVSCSITVVSASDGRASGATPISATATDANGGRACSPEAMSNIVFQISISHPNGARLASA